MVNRIRIISGKPNHGQKRLGSLYPIQNQSSLAISRNHILYYSMLFGRNSLYYHPQVTGIHAQTLLEYKDIAPFDHPIQLRNTFRMSLILYEYLQIRENNFHNGGIVSRANL